MASVVLPHHTQHMGTQRVRESMIAAPCSDRQSHVAGFPRDQLTNDTTQLGLIPLKSRSCMQAEPDTYLDT